MVIIETDNGMKLAKTIAKPAILLTDAWLGMRKKKTAAEIMDVASVRIIISFINANFFIIIKSPF